ncbi:MAG: GTPase domain-containing protein [Pirellulales bacterium]
MAGLRQSCRTLIERLLERTATLRLRVESPLVVATLGGTGVGKSTLVNALCGDEVSEAGRQRPTTKRPTFISRPGLTPETFGIDPLTVNIVERDLPLLREMVLIDCPDPDTTEDATAGETNLARLRGLLPHCDVLIVVSTQQKYRSARVTAELAAAASGARLVFVQTHADQDDDLREDWRRVLAEDFTTGEMFFVDGPAALADAKAGIAPRGDFGRLVDFLTRQLAGSAAARIRRANFLDLVDETLRTCQERLTRAVGAIEPLEAAINEQRTKLAALLIGRVGGELSANRRLWEDRLVDAVTDRWGFSPFSCLLRAYQAMGSLLSGYGLSRVRTPAQLALWGMFETSRRWKQYRDQRSAEGASERAALEAWSENDLRTAAIIVDGYTGDAQLPRTGTKFSAVTEQADAASREFVGRAAADLQQAVDRLAKDRAGSFIRFWYESLLVVVVGALVYRFLKNFLYDSWLAAEFELGTAKPLYGLEFFLAAGVVLAGWCGLLLWSFTSRLKRGIGGEIAAFQSRQQGPAAVVALFAPTETDCREARRLVDDLAGIERRAAELRRRVTTSDLPLGHKR